MICIPKGCAHGFQTLTDNVEMIYFHSEFYNVDAEAGLNYKDPSLNINCQYLRQLFQTEIKPLIILKRPLMGWRYNMKCRNCDHSLSHVFADLQSSPPSNSFLTEEQLKGVEYYFPLKVFVCDKCFLVQVDEHKKTETIFDSEYVYFSSFSTSWLEHARNYVDMIVDDFELNSENFVVEVASNDGYLLKNFVEKKIPCLGIEPTDNTAEVAREKGIETLTKFFGVNTAKELKEENRLADLIIGNNVLAHVPDIHDFVGGFSEMLKPEGIVTLEFPYLANLVDQNQFDTIYHEHFSYLSITALNNLLPKHGLEIFKIDEISTHGGSLRIYLKRTSSKREIDNSVTQVLEKEDSLGMNRLEYYQNFQNECFKIKTEFLQYLLNQK